jgi:hypothetical protein
VTDQLLRNISRKITQAQESIVMDRPWEVDARLREVRRMIRAELYGDYDEPKRERLVSRGLHRSRKPRTEE